ncbi:glycosyltransferase family 2 protein [Aliiroseovarius sp. S2029]|uniref:glycosyltransferase family 2 protein n=1 Tax=Aliiroseovarius sp. S2029 TaxID=2936988 RepID=UPI0020BF6264|nr:glycosyltransferase family 2 protein [Aliiroseovarius sp. S2029]MCK8483464.1 glycosyltransferase family 2 protein [Aliiroseovarius sp. S2029]
MAGSSRDTLLDDSSPVHRDRPLITLIIPVFNEEQSIPVFLDRTTAALEPLRGRFDVEYLFVNDGSRDATERAILACREDRPEISLVNLSRNFGKEAALSAGLTHARGDAAIPIDVDLQDPPEVILQMVRKWQDGAKVVNARRARRDADTWAKRASAGLFYRLFNVLADHPIPTGVGDFRLLDREVVDAICAMGERSRFNKAIFSWVGFETTEVEYDRPARAEGDSQWSYWKLWKLALDGIFASSTTPLRIWTYVGLSMAVASLFYSAFLFFRTLLLGVDTPGYASTAILILTFGGMNMFALGIIGEYVGRIYTEVRQRPLYIVRSYLSRGSSERS